MLYDCCLDRILNRQPPDRDLTWNGKFALTSPDLGPCRLYLDELYRASDGSVGRPGGRSRFSDSEEVMNDASALRLAT